MAYLLGIFFLGTILALFFGLFVFSKGGEINKKYGNMMMRARIILQFLAIIAALALLAISTSGGN